MLGILDYIIVDNDFDQIVEHTEIIKLKDLVDNSGHIESPRMSFHNNCDIPRPLCCLSLAYEVTYVTND